MTTKTKVGLWICRGITIIFAILEARGCYKHQAEDWAGHAHFHAWAGLCYYLGLALAFFFITGKPFKNREKWAWWSLPLMGIFVFGGQLFADALTGGLRGGGTSQGDGMMFFYLAITALVLYLIGGFLAHGHFKEHQSE